MTKKLSDRNTKKELLEGYEELCKKLEEKANTEHNPEKIIKAKEKQEVAKVVEEVKKFDVEVFLDHMKEEVGKFSNIFTQLSDVHKAIEIGKKDLEELYGIKANAYTLTALLNMQKNKEEEHKAKLEAERQEFEAEKTAYEEEKKAKEAEIEKLREREEADRKYNLDRQQKTENDKLADILKEKEKKFNEEQEAKEKDFANRLANLEAKENDLQILKDEINSLKTQLTTIVAETEEKTKKKLEESNSYAIRFTKQDLEQKNALIQSELEYLKKDLENEKTKNSNLESKLDEAYKEMKALATTAMEAGANKDTVSKLESILKQGTSK